MNIVNEPNKIIYDTITLPNGGIIMLDRLAYEAYDSCSVTNHNHTNGYANHANGYTNNKDWKVALTFDSSDIERAVQPKHDDIELR